jgi:adhesin transport system membrane fusion protein
MSNDLPLEADSPRSNDEAPVETIKLEAAHLDDVERKGDQSAAKASRILIYSIIACFVVFILWALKSRLEVVSIATGEVIPASLVKSVQHLEGGIVSEILIKDGDKVAVDQPLIVLQSITSGADVGELTLHIAGLRVDTIRLEAESEDREAPIFPDDIKQTNPGLVEEATKQFYSRRDKYQTTIRTQQETINQREQAANEIAARIKNTREALKLMSEQVAISEELIKNQLSNRLTHLNLLREQSTLRSRLDEDTAGLKRTEAAIKETESQLVGIRHGYQDEVKNQLAKARRDLDEMSERLKKYSDSFSRTTLRSPVAGVIKTVYVTTRGGVVQAGKTVIDIVPAEDRLVVEAKLPIYDVGYVRAGQTAFVRLASSDGNRFGNIAGQVVNVSPDSIITDKGAYYKVRIETETDHFRHELTEYRLMPGIQVTASIVTGERTVFDYLIDPLRGYSSWAMRER